MTREDFQIGMTFWLGRKLWRCTDIGTRTVVAIGIDQVRVGSSNHALRRILPHAAAAAEGWFNGPPYAVAETVFDENDIKACTLSAEGPPE